MVFCYKILTESPRRSMCSSPRKRSPSGHLSSTSNFECFDTVPEDNIFDLIPERDWRLLGALARKREERDERERLAEEFQKMWLKEREEREMVEAEMSDEYKRYLHKKRSQERRYLDHRRGLRAAEQQARRGQLLTCIRHKERRSAELLATKEDQMMIDLIDKAVGEKTRALLAADRRGRLGSAEEWRRQVDLVHGLRKATDASHRRSNRLKEASQRLAINRALSSWETCLIRQEVAAQDAARRAHAVARSVMADSRSARVERAREFRRKRARAVAGITARMREAVMNS